MSNPYKPGAPIHPGQAPQGPAGGKPENYLIHSIIATVCCCVPLGIVAIVFAAQVDSKWNQGDFAGSKKASDSAKMWLYIAVGLGLLANILAIGAQFALIANDPNFR